MNIHISTDSCTCDIDAESPDAAAATFARTEMIRGVLTMAELERYLVRVGGYGHITVDGVEIWRSPDHE